MEYSVYVLIKNKKPIYVGCTKNIDQRIKKHRKTKIFDKFIIVKSYHNREMALCAENAILRYENLFASNDLVNKEYVNLTSHKLYY